MAINQNNIPRKEKENLKSMIHGKINGLYYYYLDGGLLSTIVDDSGIPLKNGPVDNTAILGTTSAIANIAYAPFLNLTANDLYRVRFDTERFGTVFDYSSSDLETNLSDNLPFVFRINKQDEPTPVEIMEVPIYPQRNLRVPTKDDPVSPIYESKLLQYPYRSLVFLSNVFDQYEVVPQMMAEVMKVEDNRITLKAVCPVNPGGNFYLSVPGYKRDFLGVSERMYAGSSMDMPNTSSAYSQYMATQKARTAVSTVANVGAGLATMAGGIVTGNPLNIAGGMASIGSAVAGNMAMKQDLRSTPNTLRTMGGDMLTRFGEDGAGYVYLAYKTIDFAYEQLITDYFHMYGYKLNQRFPISSLLGERYYFNYIKTVGANIRGNGVPKKHLEKMKQVFDKGATFWNVYRDGVKIQNYDKQNAEVNPPRRL